MEVPPPRFNPADTQGRIRRSPRGKQSPQASKIRALATQAMSVGTADLANYERPREVANEQRMPRTRFALGGASLYVFIAAILVVACAVVIVGLMGRDSAAHIAIATQAPIPATDHQAQGAEHQEHGAFGAQADPTAPSASSPTDLVIHVSGAVHKPGLVTITAPARVNDAVMAAGGLTEDAQAEAVNLAEPIADGMHIHIPGVDETSTVQGTAIQDSAVQSSSAQGDVQTDEAQTALININTATQRELEEIPGVGPVTAAAIMTWREENGSFTAVEQLLEVSGIGAKTLETMRSAITVD